MDEEIYRRAYVRWNQERGSTTQNKFLRKTRSIKWNQERGLTTKNKFSRKTHLKNCVYFIFEGRKMSYRNPVYFFAEPLPSFQHKHTR